jgi:nucleoside-diphosphate-sugar epimerase
VPLGLARFATAVVETLAKATGRQTAPLLTRARLKFLTLNLDYSIDKARSVLGYQGSVDFQQGMKEALDAATAVARASSP